MTTDTARARLAEVQVALMLLSRLPTGRIGGTAPPLAETTWAWPLAGLVIGVLSALAFSAALHLGLPPALAAVLALATGVLATGGLHEDGLADLADGLGGGRSRDDKLAIMRDSRIGSYGTLALILSLGARGTAIATHPDAALALVGLAAASRACLPAALALMPAARHDGLGKRASGGTPGPAFAAAAIGLLCLLPLGPGTALVAALAMALAAMALGLLAHRQIGGQTGDVLGAMQQTAEIAGWLALLASL